MIVDFEIPSDIRIDHLDSLFSKYKSFKSIKRELKINSILDKKLELEIKDIKLNEIGFLSTYPIDFIHHPKESAFKISEMTIGINKGIVNHIKCEIHLLDTPNGKILSKIIESSIDIKFKLLISKSLGEYHKIVKFYAIT